MELYPKDSSEVTTSPDGFGASGLELAMPALSWFHAEWSNVFGLCSCVNCTGEQIRGLVSLSVRRMEHWLQLSLLVLLDAKGK